MIQKELNIYFLIDLKGRYTLCMDELMICITKVISQFIYCDAFDNGHIDVYIFMRKYYNYKDRNRFLRRRVHP